MIGGGDRATVEAGYRNAGADQHMIDGQPPRTKAPWSPTGLYSKALPTIVKFRFVQKAPHHRRKYCGVKVAQHNAASTPGALCNVGELLIACAGQFAAQRRRRVYAQKPYTKRRFGFDIRKIRTQTHFTAQ